MKLLCYGDVVGKIGRQTLIKAMPAMRQEFQADAVIANIENAAHGFGITEKIVNELFDAGLDLATTGDHAFDKPESFALFQSAKFPMTRPGNMPPGAPGSAFTTITLGSYTVLVMNLLGRVFMKKDYDCPFRMFDAIMATPDAKQANVVLVDFHAEATSEKVAFAYHAAGRCAAVFGTHTHVPTADQRILDGGTAMVTDLGMTGAADSIIGFQKEPIVKSFVTQLKPIREIPETNQGIAGCVLIEIDPQTGKAVKIDRVDRKIQI